MEHSISEIKEKFSKYVELINKQYDNELKEGEGDEIVEIELWFYGLKEN